MKYHERVQLDYVIADLAKADDDLYRRVRRTLDDGCPPAEVAAYLGIHPATMYRRLAKRGLQRSPLGIAKRRHVPTESAGQPPESVT